MGKNLNEKLQLGRSFKTNLFTVRIVIWQNRLPREAVQSVEISGT